MYCVVCRYATRGLNSPAGMLCTYQNTEDTGVCKEGGSEIGEEFGNFVVYCVASNKEV